MRLSWERLGMPVCEKQPTINTGFSAIHPAQNIRITINS